ncbi:hypothetical protein F5Y15DRAFT_252737 [Xylariaceae sp. FL0016]|nr:hypothetical protein F5Y15DRAFT_252737 [Xylariaceae sp. FL0016]
MRITSCFTRTENHTCRPYVTMIRGLRIGLHVTAHDDSFYMITLDYSAALDDQGSSFLALYLKKLPANDECTLVSSSVRWIWCKKGTRFKPSISPRGHLPTGKYGPRP